MNYTCLYCNKPLRKLDFVFKIEYSCPHCKNTDLVTQYNIHPNFHVKNNQIQYYYLAIKHNNHVYSFRGSNRNDYEPPNTELRLIYPFRKYERLYEGPFFQPSLQNLNQDVMNFFHKIIKLLVFL